jgi:SAM-dependent methyltransferase
MNNAIRRNIKRLLLALGMGNLIKRPRIAHGPEGIKIAGHRRYVGGMWEEIGQLQFDYLVSQGLRPEHVFCDVACGSLRAGVHLIPYLNAGNYLGIEKETDLVKAGVEKELSAAVLADKKPEFVISSSFEFEKFTKQPQFAIAQSLFTHLPPEIIRLCFRKLLPTMASGGVFYGTYFETENESDNPTEAHDHGFFVYTRKQMLEFGEEEGWKAEYVGSWNHPRDQVIVRYVKI